VVPQADEQSESDGDRHIVHPARESDLAAVLELVAAEKAGNPWLERIPELVEQAIRERSDEYQMCVAELSGEFAGCGIYGLVAGTVGTAILYFVGVERRARETGTGTGDAILAHVLSDLMAKATRLVVAEIPAHESFDIYRSLLEAHGFVEESRIEDYYRDGVSLMHYRLDPK
jgi:ribosomal protein S18 acetylase RimI-like enzyme